MNADSEWLTPAQAAPSLGCSDQTVIARIKTGHFAPEDVRIGPAGARPRYQVRASAVWGDPQTPGDLADVVRQDDRDDLQAGLLRDELTRARRDLAETSAERDRLRAEVVRLKEAGLHLTRAMEAFFLPGTVND